MTQNDEFSIGVLSERSGVNIETIRYYEKIGVMPKPVGFHAELSRLGA